MELVTEVRQGISHTSVPHFQHFRDHSTIHEHKMMCKMMDGYMNVDCIYTHILLDHAVWLPYPRADQKQNSGCNQIIPHSYLGPR